MPTAQGFNLACKDALQTHLTPLQRHEIEQFLEAATKEPNKDLRKERQHILDRWTAIYSDMIQKTSLFRQLPLVKEFLSDKLLEDYLGVPCETPKAFMDVFSRDGGERFRSTVLELRLDPRHAQRRLNAVLRREGRPGNDVQELADEGQWRDLALTLLGDAKLLKGAVEPAEQAANLGALSNFQAKYFSRLVSEDDFTLVQNSDGSESHHSLESDVNDDPRARLLK